MRTERFENDGRDFSGINAAKDWLRAAGFSVGPLQRGAPIAAMFGEWDVMKWRNLSTEDKARTHVRLQAVNGSYREGLVFATISNDAPAEAVAAFCAAQERRLQNDKG